MHVRSFFAFAALCSALAAACGSSTSSPSGGSSGGPVVASDIGAEGGTVTSGDGRITLKLAPGSLTMKTSITLQSLASPPAGTLGVAAEIGPTGTTFGAPATLTFAYGAADLGGHAETELKVLTYANSTWTALPSTVDTNAKTVTASLAHLSTYGMGVTTTVPQNCSLPAGGACPACDSGSCTGATPFAYCVPGVDNTTKMGGGSCVTMPTCICLAHSKCTASAFGCGTDCSKECVDAATPYAVCVAGMSSASKTGGGGCTSNASCTCSATAPAPPDMPDSGTSDASKPPPP